MVKIGVRVYTTLTAMQSLHALGNLCVCVDVCICITCLCLYVQMCICIFCFIAVCIIYISHIALVAPPSIVSRGQTHSWWSLEYLY